MWETNWASKAFPSQQCLLNQFLQGVRDYLGSSTHFWPWSVEASEFWPSTSPYGPQHGSNTTHGVDPKLEKRWAENAECLWQLSRNVPSQTEAGVLLHKCVWTRSTAKVSVISRNSNFHFSFSFCPWRRVCVCVPGGSGWQTPLLSSRMWVRAVKGLKDSVLTFRNPKIHRVLPAVSQAQL